MGEPVSEVLTIEELAEYLKIPKSTLYKLVREGSVPCQKVGKHWLSAGMQKSPTMGTEFSPTLLSKEGGIWDLK